MTVPSEMAGAAAPVLPAFLATQSRATRNALISAGLVLIDGLRLWSKLLRLRAKVPVLPLKPLRGWKLNPLRPLALLS